MESKDMKKFFVIQYIIIGLLVVVCLFLLIDKVNNDDVKRNQEVTENDYDVSMMNEVTVADAINLFEDNKAHVLYIGRASCGVCKTILPNLQTAQEDLDYVTQYMDITKVNRNSSEWEKFEELLDKETSLTINNSDGERELVTESYGYFLGNFGYTPSLIIINNNEMVAGHIGNFSLNDLKEWLQANGIG